MQLACIIWKEGELFAYMECASEQLRDAAIALAHEFVLSQQEEDPDA